MNAWIAAAVFLVELSAVVAIALYFHHRGYVRGRLEGERASREDTYLRGRMDADGNWWYGIEQQVARERQKIWKEEP